MNREVTAADVKYAIERMYTKQQILELYLNKVYFGDGLYGIEAAARGYLGKHASDLNVADSALLAGLVKSPSSYAPTVSMDRAVATVFENFRYTAEWRDGQTTILFFEANVRDRELQGIDLLEENEAGLVERFTVMIRPLSGLQAVAAAMSARLGLA